MSFNGGYERGNRGGEKEDVKGGEKSPVRHGSCFGLAWGYKVQLVTAYLYRRGIKTVLTKRPTWAN